MMLEMAEICSLEGEKEISLVGFKSEQGSRS